jgi:hypothetical protein
MTTLTVRDSRDVKTLPFPRQPWVMLLLVAIHDGTWRLRIGRWQGEPKVLFFYPFYPAGWHEMLPPPAHLINPILDDVQQLAKTSLPGALKPPFAKAPAEGLLAVDLGEVPPLLVRWAVRQAEEEYWLELKWIAKDDQARRAGTLLEPFRDCPVEEMLAELEDGEIRF